MICDETEASESSCELTSATPSPVDEFRQLTEEMWVSVGKVCDVFTAGVEAEGRTGMNERSTHADLVGIGLVSLLDSFEAGVKALLDMSA